MSLLRGGGVLEDLEVGAGAEPVEADLADDAARVHPELHGHPVVVGPLGAERVDGHGSEDVDEEPLGFVEVGHRHADVIDSTHPGQPSHVGYNSRLK